MYIGRTNRGKFFIALIFSSFVSFLFFIFSGLLNHGYLYSYLLWNLFLAWIPLLISIRLVVVLRSKSWSSWEPLILSLIWLVFLPNSFYMISDFIHIANAPQAALLYYAITITSIIFNAVMLGYVSLFLVRAELSRRLSKRDTTLWILLILLICSYAIYIGRDLRWNSWDVLTNPGGIIFDISNQLLQFHNYGHVLILTGMFFAFLTTIYSVLWRGIKIIRK